MFLKIILVIFFQLFFNYLIQERKIFNLLKQIIFYILKFILKKNLTFSTNLTKLKLQNIYLQDNNNKFEKI